MPTKLELRQQVEELSRSLRQAEEERDEALERAEEADLRAEELQGEKERLQKKLAEALESHEEEAESTLENEKSHVRLLEAELEKARDEIDRLEWQREVAERDLELSVARAREGTRVDHKKELETREELIALLKEKVQLLTKGQALAKPAPAEPVSGSGSETAAVSVVTVPTKSCEDTPKEKVTARNGRSTRMSLPTLSPFSGDESKDDGESFDRWIRRLERHAELEQWTDREKLVHLELRLKGRAERLFEILPDEVKRNYSSAVEGLRKRLTPVRREALVSAQLMKRKQKMSETVDQYAQDFESLFEHSYGRRSGMDTESKALLKRDLFVLGLKLKWQEKVLPSAETFADCLHQARAAEEQERQLGELHPSKAAESSRPSITDPPHQKRPDTVTRCHRCGSTRHKVRDCPMKKPTEATGQSSTVKGKPLEGSLDEQSRKLRDKWTEVEYRRMAKAYQPTGDVDTVTGSLGRLFYATVKVAGVPVEAMVDTGSSATIMSFDLFQKVGKAARIPREELRPPDVVLHDYNRRPIPIGAGVELCFEWNGERVTTVVYLKSELGTGGEPCLLGTNVVIPLGLMVPGDGVETRQAKAKPSVRLVQGKRVPSHSAVVVKAQLETDELSDASVVFEPNRNWMNETGLQAEESVLGADHEGFVHLLIQNPTHHTRKLDVGATVGHAELFESPKLTDSEEWGVPVEHLEDGPVQAITAQQEKDSSGEPSRREVLAKLIAVGGELEPDEKQKIGECVLSAHDVFSLSTSDRGEVDGITHDIDTDQSPPVRQPLRRVPFALRPKIKEMVEEMLELGVIQESNSPWSSPVVLVKKRGGDLRFCVDYRALNAVTRKDVFPMPRIDDMLDQLGGKRIFSTLDARSGYWQIKLGESSREKTAFATHDGLFEFRVLPFGVCNGPATFQRVMQQALRGLSDLCSVYVDDIIVFSRTVEDHVSHLEQVFSRLREVGLRLHPAKCRFASPQVEFLGHLITAEGILPNPAKISAVKEFRNPTNVKEVRQFLGIAGYYRRFVPNFSKVAGPLHDLTKQDVQFQWTPQCQESFDQLKVLLTSPPVLAYPDFEQKFTLYTDASGQGLGAVLEQQVDGHPHPIAYASRSLTKHEKNYGITDLEALALVWGLRHFRAYLLGHHCAVVTDHAPLKSMLKARHSSGKLARWSQTIAEMDVEIVYRPGKKHSNADALSRSPLEQTTSNTQADVSQVTETQQSELVEAQRKDPKLQAVVEYLEQGILPADEKAARKMVLERPRFALVDGVLCYVDSARGNRSRIAVPDSLKSELMREAHAGSLSGHFAAKSLYDTLTRLYWWDGMYGDVHRFVRGCLTCAARGGTGRRQRAPLQPLPVSGPFQRVGVDIMEMPQTERGNRYVIVFVDYLTKWVEACATQDQTSETIARLLVDTVVCRHGVPAELLSDRGANLLSELIRNVCSLLGVHKINTTAYHPQCDGLVENLNRTLQEMMAKHAREFGPDWDLHLQQLLFAYRAKPHASAGESPFCLIYGRDPRLPTETCLSPPQSKYVVDVQDYCSDLHRAMSSVWQAARKNVVEAQKRQKRQYDKKAKEHHYRIGERVMVYMPWEKTGKKRKLALPYHGPYRIVDVLPNGLSVRPVDKVDEKPILVNVDRVTLCPQELPDETWLGSRKRRQVRTHQQRQKSRTASKPHHRYELRSRSDIPHEDMC